MKSVTKLPEPGRVSMTARQRFYVDFILNNHLLQTQLWRNFVRAFEMKADDADKGWRGEYWGKMMRGACLIYRCTADPDLYDVLTVTVKELLSTAEDDGRISSYSRDCECTGWDLWCRKYVLSGMLHYCDICKDPALVRQIIDAMCRHVDCIMAVVGEGEGKKPITETSDFWFGVNSCSILEPVVDLYDRCGENRIFDFASYIIGTGGCGGGNLIELALRNECPPYKYPETKAYETISFFEGVLAYYEVTGKEKYLTAALNFAEQVDKTEITMIGCAGCTHELFDHAVVRQTEPSEQIMQETCVTVTWMRYCARLFLLTQDERFAERVERSAVNALYGSVNLYSQKVMNLWEGKLLSGLPFDSYSPLYMNRRGRGVGGLKYYPDGFYYGCCACIAAAGIAVYPLIESVRAQKKRNDSLRLYRLNGKIAFTYGPYTLARDEMKEGKDISLPVRLSDSAEPLRYHLEKCEENESVRLILETENGPVLLTDYASCGKKWEHNDSMITVWMNET